MPSSCKSVVSSNTQQLNVKPMNIFFVWYAELCRRSNTCPLSIVKPAKPKNDTVLDFVADRIKPEEWTPILNALRLDTSLHIIAIRSRIVGCKFLYEIDSEDKVRHMKRRCASLWTDYVLKSVIRSLNNCIRNTKVLSTLDLDGLPVYADYLELLLQNIRHNRTIKTLSFKHCPVSDMGCQHLCSLLRFMPNVEVINLSSCNLSSISGQYIAELIKHQQINRYCESWHNSLRYEDPTAGIMAGLKRITLNNNPEIGDDGLNFILDVLDDDLWIKAIDMQKCNITEQMSTRLIEVVDLSKCLEVADFRNNESLSFATIEKILEALEKKQQFGNDPEYQWCATTTTLYDFGTCDASSTNLSGMTTLVQKSKSAPLGQMETDSRNQTKPPLRRTKTLTTIERRSKPNDNPLASKKELENARKQLVDLNAKLNLEISKRKRTEKINYELQQKLDDIKKMGSLQTSGQQGCQEKLSTVARIIGNLGLKDDESVFPTIKDSLNKKNIKERLSKTKTVNKPKTAKKVTCDRPKTPKKASHPKQQPKRVFSPAIKTTKEEKANVQNLFERFLYKDNGNEEDDEEDGQLTNLLSYYYESDNDSSTIRNIQMFSASNGDTSPLSDSDIELEKLLQEMSDEQRLSDETNHSSNETSPVLTNSSKQQDKNRIRKLLGVT